MSTTPTSRFRPFDQAFISHSLSRRNAAQPGHFSVLSSVDSTNTWLQSQPPELWHRHIVLSDCQTAGRGQRGRGWVSPPGCNIYLTIGWLFDATKNGGEVELPLQSLPLAIAVMAARSMDLCGVNGVGIKWPNDLTIASRKMAGILVETRVRADQKVAVFAGIGVNVDMPRDPAPAATIDQPWTDLVSHRAEPADPVFRDQLSARLIGDFLDGFEQFRAAGFESFRSDWKKRDVLRGQVVCVKTAAENLVGTAAGIGPQGGLLLQVGNTAGSDEKDSIRELFAGQATVRLSSAS